MSARGEALRVTVWNEGVHELNNSPENISEYYPGGIHGAVADGVREWLPGASVRTATLDEPEHGLSEAVLEQTDVLLWWGHIAHERVADEIVERVQRHVLAGMGLIVLHSGHFSKIFTRLLGTTGSLGWRNDADREVVWTVSPGHPIAAGLPAQFVVPQQEVYSEYFDIPRPDDVIFISTFEGGEVFRSGVTFTRGRGRIFYFSPGDQDYPVYNQREIRQVLANGIEWAAPAEDARELPEVSHLEQGWVARLGQ